jgi:hypothetical protein
MKILSSQLPKLSKIPKTLKFVPYSNMKSVLAISALLALLQPATALRGGHQQVVLDLPQISQAPIADGEQKTPTTTSKSISSCEIAAKPTACALGELAPFPFNCSMFYICASWGPLVQKCPNSTVFDFKKEKCVMKNETDCVGCCMLSDCDPK